MNGIRYAVQYVCTIAKFQAKKFRQVEISGGEASAIEIHNPYCILILDNLFFQFIEKELIL